MEGHVEHGDSLHRIDTSGEIERRGIDCKSQEVVMKENIDR